MFTINYSIIFVIIVYFLGRIYAAARRTGYNVLALGQHLGTVVPFILCLRNAVLSRYLFFLIFHIFSSQKKDGNPLLLLGCPTLFYLHQIRNYSEGTKSGSIVDQVTIEGQLSFNKVPHV
jgi:hypothetical protein